MQKNKNKIDIKQTQNLYFQKLGFKKCYAFFNLEDFFGIIPKKLFWKPERVENRNNIFLVFTIG